MSLGTWGILRVYFSLDSSIEELADTQLAKRKEALMQLLNFVDFQEDQLAPLNSLWGIELVSLENCLPNRPDAYYNELWINPVSQEKETARKLESYFCHSGTGKIINLFFPMEERKNLAVLLATSLSLFLVLIASIIWLFPFYETSIIHLDS